MDELIDAVAGKAGLTADQARIAVETVVEHLHRLLPRPLARQVDDFLGNSGDADSGPGDVEGVVGTMSVPLDEDLDRTAG